MHLARGATLEQARLALLAVPAPAGSAWGAVLVGAPEREPGVRRVQLTWEGAEHIELSLVPRERVDEYLRNDPRAHDSAMVAWSSLGLSVSHPSDTSESEPLDLDALARQNETTYGTSRRGVLLLAYNGKEPAALVFGALRAAPRALSYVVWLLE